MADPKKSLLQAQTASARLVGEQSSSQDIVQKWANLPDFPPPAADLKTLWGGSHLPHAADWNAGAAELAAQLKPYSRPGQVIDQAYIQALNPSNVTELAKELGW